MGMIALAIGGPACVDRVSLGVGTSAADSTSDGGVGPTSGGEDPPSSTSTGAGGTSSETSDDTEPTGATADPGTSNITCGSPCCGSPDCPDTSSDGCDLWLQDCREGQKCMPWTTEDGDTWNDTRCVPLEPDPARVGDSCMVVGSGMTGLDDCALGAMCWGVDEATNIGTCVPFCGGSEAMPVCDDPSNSCAMMNNDVLILCLPSCDPLLSDCVDGQACYGVEDVFVCMTEYSGDLGAYGDPCEYINDCDPGLFCASGDIVPGCEENNCCSEYCDLGDPDAGAACSGAAEGQVCIPWFNDGEAPPGLEHVGACAVPYR